jgi:drug/metabolite transporter (DMT)-like permease
MDLWIIATLGAAAAQTLRFALQKRLKGTGLTSAGATFARFVWSAPLAAGVALAWAQASGQAIPAMSARFWAFALTGGLAQILATVCVMALFSLRNFAVGLTLKNTEVLLTVPIGLVLLGEGVALAGAIAIGLGFLGVILLSDPPGGSAGALWRRVLNPAAALGLAAGALFAISAVGYRGASLALGSGDAALRAATTLAVVTVFQTAAMTPWLALREPGQIGAVLRGWRVAGLVGLTSMIGSLGWFLAFTLQNAAYVRALGQVELIFGIGVTALVFREPIRARELAGMALLGAGALGLILFV